MNHENEGFWTRLWEIFSDPAHMGAELLWLVLVDIVILGLLWPLVRQGMRRIARKEHAIIEAEHGLVHPESSNETEDDQFPANVIDISKYKC